MRVWTDSSFLFADRLFLPSALVLNDSGISKAGDRQDIAASCAHVVELDLSHNQLNDWGEVGVLEFYLNLIRFFIKAEPFGFCSRQFSWSAVCMLPCQQLKGPKWTLVHASHRFIRLRSLFWWLFWCIKKMNTTHTDKKKIEVNLSLLIVKMQAWDVKLLLHCGPQTTHFGLERAEPVKLPFLSVIRRLTTLYYFGIAWMAVGEVFIRRKSYT